MRTLPLARPPRGAAASTLSGIMAAVDPVAIIEPPLRHRRGPVITWVSVKPRHHPERTAVNLRVAVLIVLHHLHRQVKRREVAQPPAGRHDLHARVAKRLALLGGQQRAQRLGVRVKHVGRGQHGGDAGPAIPAPPGEGRVRRRDRASSWSGLTADAAASTRAVARLITSKAASAVTSFPPMVPVASASNAGASRIIGFFPGWTGMSGPSGRGRGLGTSRGLA